MRVPGAGATVALAAPLLRPVVAPVVRAGLARVFGPPLSELAAAREDPGLFGPGSASWRVVADPAAIVGGFRALMVQLLHPLAVAGVAEHSRFHDDPVGRLRATSRYVSVTTFGSTAQALDAAARVRTVHRYVRGVAPDGRAYAADDPDLLGWVSVALTSSFLATDAAYAASPLDPAGRDRFVAEQARAAALLDPRVDLTALSADRDARAALRAGELSLPLIDEGWLPTSETEMTAALDRYRPALVLDAAGRRALRFLLWPPFDPLVRAVYAPVLAGALATVEPDLRARLGLRLPPGAAMLLRAHTRALVATLRLAIGPSADR